MPTDSNQPQNTFWWKLVHLEPTLIRGLVVAVVAMLGTVGILVSDDLANNLITAWVAITAIAQALWTRDGATANARVVVEMPDPVNAPDVVTPGEAVTDASATAILDAARTGV